MRVWIRVQKEGVSEFPDDGRFQIVKICSRTTEIFMRLNVCESGMRVFLNESFISVLFQGIYRCLGLMWTH